MNKIFYALVAIAFVYAAIAQVTWHSPETEEGFDAVQLSDGSVMAVGMSGAVRWNGKAFKLASWVDLEAPLSMRRDAQLVALSNGDALLIGGRSQPRTTWNWLRYAVGLESLQPTDAVERWSMKTGKWEDSQALPASSESPAVVEMADGSILWVGSVGDVTANTQAFRWAPEMEEWKPLPALPGVFTEPRLVRLDDGDIVVVADAPSGGLNATRLDVATGIWSDLPSPPMSSKGLSVVAGLEGLVAVGSDKSCGLTLESDAWTCSEFSREDATLVRTGDGSLLAVGGRESGAEWSSSVWSMAPGSSEWSPMLEMDQPRPHVKALAAKGGVLLVGGAGGALVQRTDVAAWMPSWPESPMGRVGAAMLERAETAVMGIVLPLIGGMTLFLGAMKVAEAGGLMAVLAKLIRPIMVRLFPEVPPDHPAMGAMILNMSANALGLGNAATPFGIRAMEQLDSLNTHKGTATNAMALFLAINTSNVTILPTGVIVLRAINGSMDPGGILVTTLFATICSTSVAILAAKLYQRFSPMPAVASDASVDEDTVASPASEEALPDSASQAYPWWVSAIAITALLSLVPLAVIPTTRPYIEAAVPWIIPSLIAGLLTYGFARGVPVYETFVAGAKDGWNIAVKIIPFVVGILVVIAMLKSSGAMEAFTSLIGPLTSMVGLPAEALPMALLRPLSGSGAMGVMIDTISDPAVGPDSYTGYLVSTFQGSTETTFYVLAVYFGAVGVKRVRHSIAAALTADAAGVIAAIVICSLLYGAV